jgi:hypothetical protein
MQSAVGRIIMMVVGGVAIVAGSFVSTLYLLDRSWPQSGSGENVIHIVEATWGKNCDGFRQASGAVVAIKIGNATASVSKRCEGATATCNYVVTNDEIGDPAGGCGKDFTTSWRCGTQSNVHQISLPPEAYKKTAALSCQAP